MGERDRKKKRGEVEEELGGSREGGMDLLLFCL